VPFSADAQAHDPTTKAAEPHSAGNEVEQSGKDLSSAEALLTNMLKGPMDFEQNAANQ
jgi:hypothetical protein